jgi:hypothetical protein
MVTGTVELVISVADEKSREARSLLRAAHGWQVH